MHMRLNMRRFQSRLPDSRLGSAAWLAERPTGRFEFTFAPKHGSWLNIVEGFFSKLARSVLRHIRVASKQELKDRITAAMDHFNRDPVVRTWSYKHSQAA
jgi:transposase